MSAPQIPLQLLLERTCEAFGVTLKQIRGAGAAGFNDARFAFCRLATRSGAGGQLVIGMKIGRTCAWVDRAVWEAGQRFDQDREFAERCEQIMLECMAEVGVAERTVFHLPHTSEPRDIAARLISTPRDAMSVGVADLAAIGAAYLALDAEVAELRAFKPVSTEEKSYGQVA